MNAAKVSKDDDLVTVKRCREKHRGIWVKLGGVLSVFGALGCLAAYGINLVMQSAADSAGAAVIKAEHAVEESHEAVEAVSELKAVLPFIVKGIDDIRASQIRHEDTHSGGGL